MVSRYAMTESDRAMIFAALLESARQFADIAKQPLMIENGLAVQFAKQAKEAEQLAEKIEQATYITLAK